MTKIKTTCPYCGVGCGIEVTLKSNASILPLDDAFKLKVKGDVTHPANFGSLCVKGAATGETLNFEGRLMTPLIEGQKASIDDAIALVARKFQQTIDEYGANSVAVYVSGQLLTEDYYVANKLAKGFLGTANIDTNSRLCMSSAVAGYKRAFGTDTVPCSYEDLEKADLVIIEGSNTAWAHPITYQRIVAAKKERPDMKVVVIDPRRTATCEVADIHLAIKPGSDASLFNGLLAYFKQQNALDTDYIERYTEGFDEAIALAESLQGNVAQVAQQCDLNLEDVQQFFDWAVARPKMVTLYSQGVNQSSSGTDKSNAIINCHLATGRIGQEGMGPFSITGQPNAMGGREVGGLANQLAAHMDFAQPGNTDRVARFWQAQNMATENGLKAVDMLDAVAKGDIKAIWIINTNPVVSMPDADKVRQTLIDCPLVVVSDCLEHTDTTDVANVVLPALTWGESQGTVTNSDRTISLQPSFMKGPEQARADWWWLAKVAQKLGYKAAFNYDNAAQIFREHAQLSGFENNAQGWLRDFDISALADISDEDYEKLVPIQWPVTAQKPQGTVRMFEDGLFFTPNRKAKFLPITPQGPVSQPTKELPFIFNTGRVRDQWHTMTRTAKTPKLMGHKAEPYVSIHPQDAQALNIEDNQWVKVSNPLGVFIGRAEITDTQRPKEVFAPMHWTAQYASHGRVDVLVPKITDPFSGQPEFKHGVVKIEPYPVACEGFILSRAPIAAENFGKGVWVKIKGKKFYRTPFAFQKMPKNAQAWAKSCFDVSEDKAADWLEYEDSHLGEYRCALMQGQKVVGALFLAPKLSIHMTAWLGDLFAQDSIKPSARHSLLAGQASGAKDVGQIICSCFGVGINTIVEAIHEQKLTSVEAIGKALKAGKNCGSCVPELASILAKELS